ncbi:hypothetical protein F8M41_019526 [Gigaspora margarita]|uniref:Uncharacterized protein n=1 Tax=Gigaspora margarita TaxID=4874 RepID=A0A8H4AJU2_GIGMA|nr:hypothetical protein F8M41_019526 [Gigaspora margarita]
MSSLTNNWKEILMTYQKLAKHLSVGMAKCSHDACNRIGIDHGADLLILSHIFKPVDKFLPYLILLKSILTV